MSIAFPTFYDKEIPPPEKFNAFVQALEAKFNAGFTSSDIQWPLVAQGNLVMGEYEITGARKIWKMVNAAEYPSLQSAVTAAGSGGVVFVPPDTTITTDGVTLVGNEVAIVGAGPSSVIKYTASPTGPMIQNDSVNVSRFFFSNLTLDGNSNASSSKHGILLKYVLDVIIHSVWFRNFSGSSIHLSNDGAAGNSCRRVIISDCHFEGGSISEKSIFSDDVRELLVTGCHFNRPYEQSVYLSAASASAFIAQCNIADNVFHNGRTTSIYVDGSGSAGAQHAYNKIADNVIEGQDADPAIIAGTSGNPLFDSSVLDNVVSGDHGGDGIECEIEKGQVADNLVFDMAVDAIDIKASKFLVVADNHCYSATNVGVRATSASSCVIHDNFVADCGTPIMPGTACRIYNNEGANGVPPASGYFETSDKTVTLPANTLQVGDRLRIWTGIQNDNVSNSGPLRITIDGNSFDVTDSVTATGKRVGHTICVVKSSTEIQCISTGHIDARPAKADYFTIGGLDFTTAIDIVVSNPGFSSASYAGLFVEQASGELV